MDKKEQDEILNEVLAVLLFVFGMVMLAEFYLRS